MGFPGGSDGKNPPANAGDLGWEDLLEKAQATHSGILGLPRVAQMVKNLPAMR